MACPQSKRRRVSTSQTASSAPSRQSPLFTLESTGSSPKRQTDIKKCCKLLGNQNRQTAPSVRSTHWLLMTPQFTEDTAEAVFWPHLRCRTQCSIREQNLPSHTVWTEFLCFLTCLQKKLKLSLRTCKLVT